MITKEEILKLIEDVKSKNILIIVEGIKDKNSLNYFFLKRIKTLNKPIYKIIEEIKEKEIAILTDLDKKGRELYGKLRKEAQKKGIKVNDKLRNALFKTDLRQIEGLKRYMERWK